MANNIAELYPDLGSIINQAGNTVIERNVQGDVQNTAGGNVVVVGDGTADATFEGDLISGSNIIINVDSTNNTATFTGDVTGDIMGDVTGNVTGTSSNATKSEAFDVQFLQVNEMPHRTVDVVTLDETEYSRRLALPAGDALNPSNAANARVLYLVTETAITT